MQESNRRSPDMPKEKSEEAKEQLLFLKKTNENSLNH